MKKIAFFDIDGTLTSEVDGLVPMSAAYAIRRARENGHLMFINTGRCFREVGENIRSIGFDGYVCGCGTNILCGGKDALYIPQTHETTMKILRKAREAGVDILFESRRAICFDLSRPLKHPDALRHCVKLRERGCEMSEVLESPNFFCDKFVVWYEDPWQLEKLRETSDALFECVDRGGNFREFVPLGCSKATGIRFVLQYYGMDLASAYAFGDSTNDLSMLNYVPGSVAMGNASPASLFDHVSYVTQNASRDGILLALEHFGFFTPASDKTE